MGPPQDPARRTLLVLGGSSDQLHLVHSARALGLAVLCLDQDPAAPGLAEADEHGLVSTRDVPAILAFLARRRERGRAVDAVLTMGSDIPDVVAGVAGALDLPGPTRECARLATDKHAMKQRFLERGVPTPWFQEVRSAEEVRAHLAERGRLVLKPVDRSGSRGVFVLAARADPEPLFARAREFAYSGRVQVEELLDGPQISTETILWDGRAATPAFADRNYELNARFHPQVMENGGELPSRFTPAERRCVEELVVAGARALGIERGVAKGDVVWTPEGPKVIEIAARLSGGDLAASLVPLATGVDYARQAIRIALGEEPRWDELEPRPGPHVANRYLFPEPGRVLAIEGEEEVRAEAWVAKLRLACRVGDLVPPMTSHAARAGVFIVVADDRATLEQRIAWVYRRLRIRTRPVAGSPEPRPDQVSAAPGTR